MQNPIGLLHVHNRGHFVLLTGYDTTNSNIFYVNDPFFSSKYYHYADVADIILYDMKEAF